MLDTSQLGIDQINKFNYVISQLNILWTVLIAIIGFIGLHGSSSVVWALKVDGRVKNQDEKIKNNKEFLELLKEYLKEKNDRIEESIKENNNKIEESIKENNNKIERSIKEKNDKIEETIGKLFDIVRDVKQIVDQNIKKE